MDRKRIGVNYLEAGQSASDQPKGRYRAAVQMLAGLQFALFLLTTLWGCGLTSGAGYKGGPPPSTFGITTPSLPAAPVSQPYSVTLAAAGGKTPFTWGVVSGSGSLPPGLSLNASTGAITGTPTAASAYTFTLQATDSSSQQQIATMPASIITVPLDQYGGRTDISCANTTGHFILSKVNNRWWFCTPAGHVFISMDVAMNSNSNPTKDCNGANTYPIYAAKYAATGDSGGTGSNWAWQELKRATSWGFNATGITSVGSVYPWTTCQNCGWTGGTLPIKAPTIIEVHTTLYASANAKGYLSEPIKDEVYGNNGTWNALRAAGNANYDIFDPKENTEIQAELANTSDPTLQAVVTNNPWVLGFITDDTDSFTDMGAGPDFANPGTNSNLGWLTVITSPVQTMGVNVSYLNKTYLYQDNRMYSKAQATNPTTQCSVSSPCSLRDYLWQKYSGSISSLNTAWGSNYTTFDSSGTQATGEIIGTGDRSTTTFTHTLAHTPVSPFSVLISVGGTAQVGDYPWFKNNGAVNTGQLLSPTSNYVRNSSINYSTGVISITFGSAPASGASVTVNYIYGGWMAGGKGLMDESGSGKWIGTNPYCLEGADPAFPTYFACTGAGGHYEPVPNANPNFGADIDNWVSQWMAKYAKNFHDGLRAAGSSVPYFGIDAVGSWGAPPYSKILQGEAPYVDMMFTQLMWFLPTSTGNDYIGSSGSPELPPAYQYLTKYAGDMPLGDFLTIAASAQSSEVCNGDANANIVELASQSLRGQMYFNTVNYLLSTPGSNGDFQFVEFDQWAWQDFQRENWGLVTLHDNAYDGREDVTSIVHCDSSYTSLTSCGGDTGNFGDFISQVRLANLLWLQQ